MEKYAPTIKDLAPRDLVSRAIDTEIREGRGIEGRDFVHLDLTHLGKERLAEKLSDISSFAKIYLGIDPAREPIPVQPTCHYMMGGNSHQPGRASTGSQAAAFSRIVRRGRVRLFILAWGKSPWLQFSP